MSDQELYQQAIDELNSDRRRPDLWARAVAIATDDHDEARDLYTNLRVEELIAERGPTNMSADAEPDFAALSLALAEGDEPAEDLDEKREEVETAFASLEPIDLSDQPESEALSLEDLTSSLEAGPTLKEESVTAEPVDTEQDGLAADAASLDADSLSLDDSIEITEIPAEESALDSLANELQSNIGDVSSADANTDELYDDVTSVPRAGTLLGDVTPSDMSVDLASENEHSTVSFGHDDGDQTLKTDSMLDVNSAVQSATADEQALGLSLEPVQKMVAGSTVDNTPDEERIVFKTSDMLITEHDQTQSRTQSFDETSSFDNDYTVDLSGSHDTDGEPVINNPEIDLDSRANQTSANDPVRSSEADDQFILNPESNPGGTAYALLTNGSGEARAIKSGVSWPAMVVTLPWLLLKGLWGTAIIYLAMLMVFVAVFLSFAVGAASSPTGLDLPGQIALGIFGILAVVGLLYLPFKYGNQWLLAKAHKKGFEQKASVLAKSTNDALGRFIR